MWADLVAKVTVYAIADPNSHEEHTKRHRACNRSVRKYGPVRIVASVTMKQMRERMQTTKEAMVTAYAGRRRSVCNSASELIHNITGGSELDVKRTSNVDIYHKSSGYKTLQTILVPVRLGFDTSTW